MPRAPVDLSPARILVVDDERQIHASIRLRLGEDYELHSVTDPREALKRLRDERFDLCFVDLHMPHLNGFAFLEQARGIDPELGVVVVSAFDDATNVKRAIPFQVLAFIGKPLPDRAGFEHRVPGWIERTRQQRLDRQLAEESHRAAEEVASAQLKHAVELVASESAREALLQTANLLTTIHAHLVTLHTLLATRAKQDSSLSQTMRNLEAARRASDAAITVAEGFSNSAYANRDTSAALLDGGIRQAIDITSRVNSPAAAEVQIEYSGCDPGTIVRSISGLDLLLLLVPFIGVAQVRAAPGSALRMEVGALPRLDLIIKAPTMRQAVWFNRHRALISHAGMQVTLSGHGAPIERRVLEAWLGGDTGQLGRVSRRGVLSGLQKCGGLLGTGPVSDHGFFVALALPI
jgi:two-component system response regulator (stage 0 sporulation protein F)